LTNVCGPDMGEAGPAGWEIGPMMRGEGDPCKSRFCLSLLPKLERAGLRPDDPETGAPNP